jgi:hypothetical protein
MSVYAYTIFDDPLVRVGPKAATRARKSPWTFACITSAATRSTLLRSRTWEESRRLAVHFSEVGPVGHQAACFRVFAPCIYPADRYDLLPSGIRSLRCGPPQIQYRLSFVEIR